MRILPAFFFVVSGLTHVEWRDFIEHEPAAVAVLENAPVATDAFVSFVFWIVHVPAAMIVTILMFTVQTDPVIDAKLTGNPEEAVALTVNGASPNVFALSAAKVMV